MGDIEIGFLCLGYFIAGWSFLYVLIKKNYIKI